MRSHYDLIHRVIEICESQGVTAHYLLDLFTTKRSTARIRVGDGLTALSLHSAPMAGLALAIKHTFDKLVALALLVVTAPILLVTAIAIKLEDGGPVFFAQERVGRNKRRFTMYKLRTMIQGAEAMLAGLEARNERDGAAFKLRDDPRVGRVGRILRKY